MSRVMTMTCQLPPTPRRVTHRAGLSMLCAVLTAFAAILDLSATATAAPKLPKVTYQLSGSAPVADYISYQTDAGQMDQAHVPLPWKTQFTAFGGQVFVISAQSPGSITCTILLDGNVVSQATSNGQPARTVCSH